MGNLKSVYNAFDYLGEDVLICKSPDDLNLVDKIVIPGVGAFRDCISQLKNLKFDEALNNHVLKIKKPTLGICLGMQVMAKKSFEFGEYKGLGWIDADVVKIENNDKFKLPNIGWCEINQKQEHFLWDGIKDKSDFYLVHSYYLKCNDNGQILADYFLGESSITAAVIKNNIVATQFHPEKSQDIGLKFLSNFVNWQP